MPTLLDRVDRGFIFMWMLWWLVVCGVQWLHPAQRLPKEGPHSIEVLRVPPFVRLMFGLAPTSNVIQLRPAIMQILAVVMMAVSLVLRRVMNVENTSLALILLGIYFIVLIVISAVLDSWQRDRRL